MRISLWPHDREAILKNSWKAQMIEKKTLINLIMSKRISSVQLGTSLEKWLVPNNGIMEGEDIFRISVTNTSFLKFNHFIFIWQTLNHTLNLFTSVKVLVAVTSANVCYSQKTILLWFFFIKLIGGDIGPQNHTGFKCTT